MTATKQLLKEAFAAIQKLKAEKNQSKNHEDIAIISMSCRLPGKIRSPSDYWSLLAEGKEGIGPIPKDRWDQDAFYDPDPEKPHKMYIKEGGFLHDEIKTFDAQLFGISPKEAEEMDPQHRMLLELSWEAFENAGINPLDIKEKKAGVFVGIISSEYSMLERESREISPYTLTGMTPHMASGRISHFYGLRGPALSIDTACSSSLVAVHEAIQSLCNNECEFALACGVNLMVAPEAMVSLCKVKALSRDGRCKPFDANGDGYGRGEGCGVVLLKKLSAAKRDGDPILAVVKGSAINHDGPTSGLTVPSLQAQVEVIQSALKSAKLSPEDIDLIEAHGTGTHLGDPIEMQALEQTYGTVNRSEPLLIGSSKANIGHCEAAAGIAALIKTVLCLKEGKVPPHINFRRLNPRIDLNRLQAEIPMKIRKFNGKAAGVSSFGFSGTNAHLIVAKWEEERQISKAPLFGFTFSAHTKEALHQTVQTYSNHMKGMTKENWEIIQYQLLACRPLLRHRVTFFANAKEDICKQMDAYLRGESLDETTVIEKAPKYQVCLEITQTNLDTRRIHDLYQKRPLFKTAFDKCAKYFQKNVDREGKSRLSAFCAQYALLQSLNIWGLPLHTIIYQGLGKEIAVAISGALPLKEVCRKVEQGEEIDLTGLRLKYKLMPWSKREEASKGMFCIEQGKWEGDETLFLLWLTSEGFSINWRSFFSKAPQGPITLLNYPFSKKSFWIEQKKEEVEIQKEPLKGKVLSSPLPILQHVFCLSSENLPQLADTHQIVHVGFVLEMISSVLSSHLEITPMQIELRDVDFIKALYVSQPTELVATLSDQTTMSFYSKREGVWELHYKAEILKKPTLKQPSYVAMPQSLPDYTKTDFYNYLEMRDLILGHSVQWVEKAWVQGTRIYAELRKPQGKGMTHYGLFDALAQLFHLGLSKEDAHVKLMVTAWEKARLFRTIDSQVYQCYLDLTRAEVAVFDEDQRPVFFCCGHQMKRLEVKILDCKINQGEDLKGYLKRVVAKLLKMNPTDIEDDDRLYELGFDSIIGMDLRKTLTKNLNLDLDLEILFKNPTFEELAQTLIKNKDVGKDPENKWFKAPLIKTQLPRLFCFPYGCGGASEYLPWIELFEDSAQVFPIQLPGREDRIEERPISNIGQLAEMIVHELQQLDTVPFAIYGHSLGALIAFRVAIELRKKKLPMPMHLFVGAYSSPDLIPNPWLAKIKERLKVQGIKKLPDPSKPIEDLQQMASIAMEEYGEIANLEEGYVLDLIPTIFADLHLVDSFKSKKIRPFDFPISAFAGLSDDRVTVEEMKRWGAFTSGQFMLHQIEGDHFFLARQQSQNTLIKTIKQTLN